MIVTKKLCDICRCEICDNKYTDKVRDVYPRFRFEILEDPHTSRYMDLCLRCEQKINNYIQEVCPLDNGKEVLRW